MRFAGDVKDVSNNVQLVHAHFRPSLSECFGLNKTFSDHIDQLCG